MVPLVLLALIDWFGKFDAVIDCVLHALIDWLILLAIMRTALWQTNQFAAQLGFFLSLFSDKILLWIFSQYLRAWCL